jgi:hypothetical protein
MDGTALPKDRWSCCSLRAQTGRSPRPAILTDCPAQTNPKRTQFRTNEAKRQIGALDLLTRCPPSQSTSTPTRENWLRLAELHIYGPPLWQRRSSRRPCSCASTKRRPGNHRPAITRRPLSPSSLMSKIKQRPDSTTTSRLRPAKLSSTDNRPCPPTGGRLVVPWRQTAGRWQGWLSEPSSTLPLLCEIVDPAVPT